MSINNGGKIVILFWKIEPTVIYYLFSFNYYFLDKINLIKSDSDEDNSFY